MYSKCLAPLLLLAASHVSAGWLEITDGRRVNDRDYIEVVTQLDGSLKFALWAAGRDDLACRMRGVAQKQAPGVFRYDEPGSQCVLRISAQNDRLVAEDLGDNCRALYCPQKASIGVRSFSLVEPGALTGLINAGW